MNLGQVHSPLYEYRAVALARFASEKLDFAQEFDLLGRISAFRPVIRVRLQKQLWHVLSIAHKPLRIMEIYARFDDEVTEKEKHSLRNLVGKWTKEGWLTATGGDTNRKYQLKGVPKL